MRKTNEKGITLVVLIITIILLLILATIVIDFIIEGSIKDRIDKLIGKADNQQSVMSDIRHEVREQVNPNKNPEDDNNEPDGENEAPEIIDVTDYKENNGKTTTKFTIQIQATDDKEGILTYTLFYKKTDETEWQNATSFEETTGFAVTIPVTSLIEYTMYDYYITVTDSEGAETISEPKQVRTYCPGGHSTATSCNDNIGVCEVCNGVSPFVCPEVTEYYATDGSSGPCRKPGGCRWDGRVFSYSFAQCTVCRSKVVLGVCDECSYVNTEDDIVHKTICPECGGNTVYITCPTHKLSTTHYYCDDCEYVGATKSHNCKHGYSNQHDD